ncbi:hypothetical protein SDC9_201744 [bioreactor metagenome]|uniref:Uncharacterized protein n=1 Tax=bioreactor metagenome TaxID=1076179 RepID=A0A645IRR8_9ZZZZ
MAAILLKYQTTLIKLICFPSEKTCVAQDTHGSKERTILPISTGAATFSIGEPIIAFSAVPLTDFVCEDRFHAEGVIIW